jgi:hypothetical protein
MWCWRRAEKSSWADCLKNKEVLHSVKEEWNTLHIMKRRKAEWIDYILRRKYLLKHVAEGKIGGNRRRGRRHKQTVNGIKATKSYWSLKEKVLECTLE